METPEERAAAEALAASRKTTAANQSACFVLILPICLCLSVLRGLFRAGVPGRGRKGFYFYPKKCGVTYQPTNQSSTPECPSCGFVTTNPKYPNHNDGCAATSVFPCVTLLAVGSLPFLFRPESEAKKAAVGENVSADC